MENYEKKYKEALETARKINSGKGVAAPKDWSIPEIIFPELKKSEDESIREKILNCFVEMKKQGCFPSKHEEQYDSWISWLKKQDKLTHEATKEESIGNTNKELKTVELMKRPSDESVRNVYSGILKLDDMLQHTFYGSEMHNSKFHGGEDTWSFPKGVREKLKNDKRYRVWYTRSDAADPCDTSSHYCVYYIEEI